MKRIFSFLIVFVLSVILIGGPLYAVEIPNDYYSFLGIDTTWNSPTSEAKNTLFVRMADQVGEASKFIDSRNKPHIIVAHSQGGLRALAYANLATRQGKSSNIKGLVLVGSPVKGFSPLRMGLDPMRSKINGYVAKANGFLHAATASVGTALFGLWSQVPGLIYSDQSMADQLIRPFLGGKGSKLWEFYDIVRKGTGKTMETVKDLAPGSPFILDNIVPAGVTNAEEVGHWARVEREVSSGPQFYWLGVRWVTNRVTEMQYIVDKPKLVGRAPNKIDPAVPIGFVRSVKPDIENSMSTDKATMDQYKLWIGLAVGGVSAINTAWATGYTITAIALCAIPFVGWMIAAPVFALAAYHMVMVAFAVDFGVMTLGTGANGLAKDLLMTDRHDGFIPASDQVRDLNPAGTGWDIGGKFFADGRKIVDVSEYHWAEVNAPSITGDTPGMPNFDKIQEVPRATFNNGEPAAIRKILDADSDTFQFNADQYNPIPVRGQFGPDEGAPTP